MQFLFQYINAITLIETSLSSGEVFLNKQGFQEVQGNEPSHGIP